jgi:hypothetical protein
VPRGRDFSRDLFPQSTKKFKVWGHKFSDGELGNKQPEERVVCHPWLVKVPEIMIIPLPTIEDR